MKILKRNEVIVQTCLPGFIDTHADRELKEPKKSHNQPFLMQGITTVVVGSDGNSFFPTSEFKALYESHGIGTNAVLMTGHGTLRKLIVGRSDRKASEEEIKNMQKLVQKEIDQGSFGLTTGLFYAPGSYSDTEEIIALAKFNMTTADIHNFMKQPWVVTGSDGNTGHPRKYGSFPRKYHKYVQQDKVLPLATFINNSSAQTAEIFKIPNRGKLKEGYFADVIIFNPKTFKDKANYTDAFQFAEGLEYSIINGQLSVENGAYTGKLNGKVLTKQNK